MSKPPALRQCLGIDVSKNHLQVNLSNQEADQRIRVISSTKFDNTAKGLEKLNFWVVKHRISSVDFKVVMEATGVYHESAAYFLHEKGFAVSVLLPNKTKAYAKSLNAKSKTDSIDAGLLARMGLERALEIWQPASHNMRRIKRLCRERVALQEQKTITLNQKHARSHEHQPEKNSQNRAMRLVKFIEKQIAEVERNIQAAVASDKTLKEKVDRICTVKGLGWISVITIIAETDGFALFKNKGQLVSFAGYDVVQNESGSSVKGTTRISKKGNRHIRRALHFPALTAVQYEPQFKNLFTRTLEKSFIKMKAYVAVQRKLLVLIYTLFKNNTTYDPNYSVNQVITQNRQEQCPA